MTLSDKDRRALVLGGIAVGVLAAYVFAIEPLTEKYDDLLAEHAALARQVARVMRENQKHDYYQTRVAHWESDVCPLSPPKSYSEQITFVGDQIVTAAKKNGVQLKGTTPAAARPWPDDPTLQIAPVVIDADADFEPVFKFIAALYRIEGVLSVENLNLTGDPKKDGKLHLRLMISVLVQAREPSEVRWAR